MRIGSALALWLVAGVAAAADVASKGEAVKLPVTRDTWLSSADGETDGSNGGAQRLKVKSYQELSLFDIDAAPLRGRVVRAATLHLRSTGEPRLKRITVGSVAAEWVEGTATDYEQQAGSSTFNRRRHPDVFWAQPGSDLCSVILGQGGTVWRMADATPPDADGWQRVAVDPSVVAARVAGVSHGFVIFDDTGSEWDRDGEQFKIRLFPNRFVFSREAGPESAPYLTVYLGPKDDRPPAAPADLAADPADLPAGEAFVTWTTPADEGPAGVAGFFVSIDGKEVPRYLVPRPGRPGERVTMHLRDLGLKPGAKVRIAVGAADGAGNRGAAAEADVMVSSRGVPELPGAAPRPFRERGELPTLAGAGIAVIDELDKVQPLTGAMVPEQPAGYLSANHLWSAADRRVRLHAARNEFVAFQVLLRGPVKGLRAELAVDDGTGRALPAQVSWYLHVKSKQGPLPDPVVPADGTALDMAANTSLHCELYVPHRTAAGLHRGKLTLRAGRDRLALDVTLRVWDFTLPDHLSFLPEMNCYGLPANERDYYRMAHVHRTVLNRVPYSQSGQVDDGCAPVLTGSGLDWRAWDARFGPLLSGSAFADLPRRGVPVECFYLPLHENWPAPMAGNYNGHYWADRAFPAAYRRAFVAAARDFADHFSARGWNDTLFHCYLNNKNNYKERGWSRGSSPWLLDEPANFQDFWALRWFGAAFHDGVNRAGRGPKMLFRADISRPQWQRDALDGVLDYNVVGAAFRRYRRAVLDRKGANGEVVLEYGGTNAVEEPNTQPVGWCLDAWSLGTDGVLPWQTVGSDDSWKNADATALFYPGANGQGVVPSVRLKAYRRGQQDVEYLTLLTRHMKEPRWAVGRAVRSALKLAAEYTSAGGDDAGVLQYAKLRPQDAWALRLRVGAVLSQAAPRPMRRLIEFAPPRRDVAALPDCYVSAAELPVVYDPPPPPAPGTVKTLQGKPAVSDTLISPEQPDRAFGAEGRNNPLRKAGQSGAFLVRFDLGRLKLPAGVKLRKATVSFFLWDPSSQGNTKVCAFGLKTPWDEATATWARPGQGRAWQGAGGFDLARDAGPAGPPVIVRPDAGDDTADPPLEYRADVTELVRAWLAGAPNHGLALVPVPDRAVDDGLHTRFQLYGSEARNPAYGPKLTVELER